MHNACLQCCFWKHRAEGLWHALEAIGHGNQHVLDATRLEVVEHLHPELRTLGVFDPDAQDIARPVG
ncbi:hypothetical protein D3C76_1619920 [compost metagenome]